MTCRENTTSTRSRYRPSPSTPRRSASLSPLAPAGAPAASRATLVPSRCGTMHHGLGNCPPENSLPGGSAGPARPPRRSGLPAPLGTSPPRRAPASSWGTVPSHTCTTKPCEAVRGQGSPAAVSRAGAGVPCSEREPPQPKIFSKNNPI